MSIEQVQATVFGADFFVYKGMKGSCTALSVGGSIAFDLGECSLQSQLSSATDRVVIQSTLQCK